MLASAEFENEISFGNGLVTCTSLNETVETFSTSNSRAIGPPSSPVATDNVRFSVLAGCVSKRSRKMSIRFPLTLYFILYSFPASNSSTETWSPPMSVASALSNITSMS